MVERRARVIVGIDRLQLRTVRFLWVATSWRRGACFGHWTLCNVANVRVRDTAPKTLTPPANVDWNFASLLTSERSECQCCAAGRGATARAISM